MTILLRLYSAERSPLAAELAQDVVCGLEGSPSMPQRFWRGKVDRPPREEMEQGVAEFGCRGSEKRDGVSDNRISQWLKFYQVPSERLHP